MSRYSHYGEERDGYDAYENRRSWESYPYERDYSYRQGWEAAERDERRERERKEEDLYYRELEESQRRQREYDLEDWYYEVQSQPEPQYPEPEYPNTDDERTSNG